MKNAFLVPLTAILVIALLGLGAAQLVNTGSIFSVFDASGITTTFNDVPLVENITTPIAGITGETVPVRVVFTAATDASDVRVKVWMEGFRQDVQASTVRFNTVDGSIYTKLLSLQLPSDINDLTKVYTLHVSVSSPDKYDEASYTVKLQRDSYSLNVLSADFPSQVSAGDLIPVSIVIKNNGMETLQDGYVTVSIAALGASSKAYFGDLTPLDNCTDSCDNQDSVQKIVYLKIPESAAAGVYPVEIKVYNSDATTTVSKIVSVGDSASTDVLAAVKNQDIKAGETKTYDMIIVNAGNKIKVYNIQTVSGTALSVSAPAVVTVAAGSSTTVPITVTALSNAAVGSYTFSVNVDGKQTVFGANVVAGGISTSVVALTVVLVIVFVVLLVVLIVLLSRKEKTEEVETSYY